MCDRLISLSAAIDAIEKCTDIFLNNFPPTIYKEDAIKAVKALPPAQPDVPDTNVGDMISRQAAIAPFEKYGAEDDAVALLESLPPAQLAQDLPNGCTDTIGRQAAINAFLTELTKRERKNLLHTWSTVEVKYFVADMLEKLPSAQPERTCVNCGRTVNNGGWYADGGTRCPIEEHYALPKDGYCHLWEKRNVTDDNYPERREE